MLTLLKLILVPELLIRNHHRLFPLKQLIHLNKFDVLFYETQMRKCLPDPQILVKEFSH
jgi:hypothetical protein